MCYFGQYLRGLRAADGLPPSCNPLRLLLTVRHAQRPVQAASVV